MEKDHRAARKNVWIGCKIMFIFVYSYEKYGSLRSYMGLGRVAYAAREVDVMVRDGE